MQYHVINQSIIYFQQLLIGGQTVKRPYNLLALPDLLPMTISADKLLIPSKGGYL